MPTAPEKPGLPDSIQEGTDVFISYSRMDSGFAQWLNEQLKATGRQAWIDLGAILPAEQWWPAIQRGIDAADSFLFVLSPDSVSSPVCAREVDHAVAAGKRIVPVVCRDVTNLAVPEGLASRNYVFLRNDEEKRANLANLFQALDTDLTHVRAHTRFLIRAREWEASGRAEGDLLRGADLIRADDWLSAATGKEPDPTQLQIDHIQASKVHERAQIDRQRRLIGRGSVKPARQALDSGLHDHALRLAGAATLLAEDVNWGLVPELRPPALEAIYRNRAVASLEGHTGDVFSASFSPDGTRIVTVSYDRTARVWDAQSGAQVATLEGHTSFVTSATFSPDGRRIVTASRDKTVRVWKAQSGALVAILQGHTEKVWSATYSPDGRRIVTASSHNTARVWDAQTGTLVATLQGHTKSLSSAAFSPDGNRIVTASEDNTARVWDVSRTAFIVGDQALSLAAALACGIGRRTEAEAQDLLMQDAPEDLYAALLEKLGPERAAQVPAVVAALRAPLHPNCYLSPTQFAEKFGLPKSEANYGTHETHGKGEEEEGEVDGDEVGIPIETAPEPGAVTAPPSKQSGTGTQKFKVTQPHRLRAPLFFVLGALAALITTGHVNVAAMGEQVRRLLRL